MFENRLWREAQWSVTHFLKVTFLFYQYRTRDKLRDRSAAGRVREWEDRLSLFILSTSGSDGVWRKSCALRPFTFRWCHYWWLNSAAGAIRSRAPTLYAATIYREVPYSCCTNSCSKAERYTCAEVCAHMLMTLALMAKIFHVSSSLSGQNATFRRLVKMETFRGQE